MQKNELAVKQKNEIAYQAGDNEVKLSIGAVKKYLVRGKSDITDSEAYMFMALCQHTKLNPFLNDIYLLKYSSSDPATPIIGKGGYLKRAEGHKSYNGYQAGIIVVDRNGNIEERQGSFMLKGETLVGGWANVARSDCANGFYNSVALEEYDKNMNQWKTRKCTMIRKVALVQSLREAFPNEFQGTYAEEEMPSYDSKEIKNEKKSPQEIVNSLPEKNTISPPEKPILIEAKFEEPKSFNEHKEELKNDGQLNMDEEPPKAVEEEPEVVEPKNDKEETLHKRFSRTVSAAISRLGKEFVFDVHSNLQLPQGLKSGWDDSKKNMAIICWDNYKYDKPENGVELDEHLEMVKMMHGYYEEDIVEGSI
jgi:phage recombination protein Bet